MIAGKDHSSRVSVEEQGLFASDIIVPDSEDIEEMPSSRWYDSQSAILAQDAWRQMADHTA